MFNALAFLPENDVVSAFEELCEYEEVPIEFISYFEITFIGAKRGRRRTRDEPMFSRSLWNVRERVLNDLPRTNNSVEAFNCAIQSTVTSYNPNVWKLIMALQKEEGLVQAKLNHIQRGEPPKRKKKYVTLDKRLKNLVENYKPEEKINFLKAVAQNLVTFN